jgi:hypothetical protein
MKEKDKPTQTTFERQIIMKEQGSQAMIPKSKSKAVKNRQPFVHHDHFQQDHNQISKDRSSLELHHYVL